MKKIRMNRCRLICAFVLSAMTSYSAANEIEADSVFFHLERVEREQTYLKHLQHLQTAVEKELSIIKLMRECDRHDGICTGQGLSLKSPQPEVLPETVPEKIVPVQPPEPKVYELPTFLNVHQGVAVARYQDRQIELREGNHVGPFTVKTVRLNYVDLFGPKGLVRISLQW